MLTKYLRISQLAGTSTSDSCDFILLNNFSDVEEADRVGHYICNN
jgi:hypothetical protein